MLLAVPRPPLHEPVLRGEEQRIEAHPLEPVLLPAVQQILAPTLKEHGYAQDDLMTLAATLSGFGGEDPSIAADTAKLMKAAQGDLSDFA